MPQQVVLKVKGLYPAPNDFASVPEGALDVADDVIIDQDNLVESRRGFDGLTYTLPLSADRATRFTYYDSYLIVQFRSNQLGYYNPASGITSYTGTFAHPDSSKARARFFEANQNLYVTTASGVYKLDSHTGCSYGANSSNVVDGRPALSGVPTGLDLQASLTGSSGFLGINSVATPTGTTTSGSPNLTLLSDTTSIAVGQYVSGTGITAGTTVSSITASSTVLVTQGTTTAGSTALTITGATTGIVVGQLVTGTAFPSGTRVSAVAGANVTLSQNATATNGTAITVTFSSDPVIVMSANATANGTGVSLTFSSGSQVAYRILFGVKDANNNILLGAPSQFVSVTNNQGATRNVSLIFTIPQTITTAHFYQIYRSSQTGSSSITPQDDMQQVYEGNPSSSDITNGYITITDIVPDSLRGQYLYTSTSQQGIAQANNQPIFCKDACTYRGFTFYANLLGKQYKKLTILSVDDGTHGSSMIQAGDTITIAGQTYTAVESGATGNQFNVSATVTSYTPAQRITLLTNSLIQAVNRNASSSVYAILLSGPADLPGQILFQERGFNGGSFAITASGHGGAYSPNLPTSGTTVSSAQDTYKHGIAISKFNQPEAVPSVNLVFAGSASKEIQRIIPLRNYIVVLKEDGIFRVTGVDLSSFSVEPFDSTCHLLSPDSAVAFENEVWGHFDLGICSISDTGVSVRSRPIENVIRALVGSALSTLKQISFGMAYETDRKYILSLPLLSGDTSCGQQYCYNTLTASWTRWTKNVTAGFIHPSEDKIYFGNGLNNKLINERKAGDYTDFADESFSVTISSSSGVQVTLADVSSINVNDLLWQDATHYSLIKAIDLTNKIVTVNDTIAWTNGAAKILPGIKSVIQWKPYVAGSPATVKQFPSGSLVFKRTSFGTGSISFYSDVVQSFYDTPISGTLVGTWGSFPWGNANWGGVNRPVPIRFLVPQESQLCSQLVPKLTIQSSYSNWAIEGLSLDYEIASIEVDD